MFYHRSVIEVVCHCQSTLIVNPRNEDHKSSFCENNRVFSELNSIESTESIELVENCF